MSNQVSTAFKQKYDQDFRLMYQQKMSKLRPHVRAGESTAAAESFNFIGPTEAQVRGGRHSDTAYQNTPHSRRWAVMADYNWADLVDTVDVIRMEADPSSSYAKNAVMAFDRTADDIILAAMFADAKTGQKGETTVAFPAGNDIGDGSTGLSTDLLMQAKAKLAMADVDTDMETPICVCTYNQVADLLKETEVKSADYNIVKALVRGEVDTWMGFKFVQTTRVKKVSTVRQCGIFMPSAMLHCTGKNITTKMDILPTKNYSTQVYVEMTMGAVRLYDAAVLRIKCKEA